MPVVFGVVEVEVMFGHDSDAELEGVGATLWSGFFVDCAPLAATEAEDCMAAPAVELVAIDADN